MEIIGAELLYSLIREKGSAFSEGSYVDLLGIRITATKDDLEYVDGIGSFTVNEKVLKIEKLS